MFGPGANAAPVYYGSNFDPPTFSLWAIFQIDQPTCLNGSVHGWVAAGGANPCQISLISAVATLKDGNPLHNTLVTFVDELVPATWLSNVVSGIYDDGGTPAGLQWYPAVLATLPIGPQTSSGPIAGKWWIDFFRTDLSGPPFDSQAALLGEFCPGGHCTGLPDVLHPVDVAAVQFIDIAPAGILPLGSTLPPLNPDGSPVHIGALVPEPGTLALILGALGAGWAGSRRKSGGQSGRRSAA
jgi:hypothetical protein